MSRGLTVKRSGDGRVKDRIASSSARASGVGSFPRERSNFAKIGENGERTKMDPRNEDDS